MNWIDLSIGTGGRRLWMW